MPNHKPLYFLHCNHLCLVIGTECSSSRPRLLVFSCLGTPLGKAPNKIRCGNAAGMLVNFDGYIKVEVVNVKILDFFSSA